MGTRLCMRVLFGCFLVWERIVSESSFNQQRIVYKLCCRSGCVSLPARRPFPSPLRELYNSMFAFTSLGVDVDRSVNIGDGPYVFHINGVVHHRIGSLIPPPGRRPEYAQLYIYDTLNEVDHRLGIFPVEGHDEPDPFIVAALIDTLNEVNPLVRKFRMARDRLVSPDALEVTIKLIGLPTETDRRYSLPTVPELAALIIGGCTPELSTFNIIVESHTSEFKHISPVHPSLTSLQYPLLFPYGDKGFHPGIKLMDAPGEPDGGREDVSMTEFYRYYAHYHRGQPNPEICSGRLSQQYGVNAYSCIEANKLNFHFFNQDLLRGGTYQGISDAIGQGATTGRDVGVKKMLPSSYIGSRRYLLQNYHDCMAICRVYGPPDKFTTFTCNPRWPEVAEAIRFEPGQQYSDRSDMVVRVFHMKLEEYLDDIKEGRIFGPVRAVCTMQYTPLKDVTPESQKWTVKVRLVRFSEFRRKEQPDKLSRLDLVLLDEEGTTMEGQILESWIPQFLPNLKEDCLYYVKYFEVRTAWHNFHAVQHTYMMRFTTHTKVYEIKPIPPEFPLYACNVVPFSELHSRAGKRIFTSDAVGLFKGCSHVIMQNTSGGIKPLRNLYITDGRETAVVALWGEHAHKFHADQYMELAKKKPLVFLFVAVTSAIFNDRLSLQGSFNCRWYANPDIPEALALRDGYGDQGPLPEWHGYGASRATEIPTTVAELASFTNPHEIFSNRYIVSVKIKGIIRNQSWWYITCDRCRKTYVPYGDTYKCTGPHCTSVVARPRYRLNVTVCDPDASLHDEDKTIQLVLFGPIAEEIIGVPIDQLLGSIDQTGGFLPPQLTRVYGKQYRLRVSVSLGGLQEKKATFQVDTILGVLSSAGTSEKQRLHRPTNLQNHRLASMTLNDDCKLWLLQKNLLLP
ncbi:hypothetical protein ACP4OV_005178 [Aristida adscensionis]